MKKKKLTNKERDAVAERLSDNDQILNNKILYLDTMLGLYLEYRGDTDKFSKFVKVKAEKFEKRQKSEDKKGT